MSERRRECPDYRTCMSAAFEQWIVSMLLPGVSIPGQLILESRRRREPISDTADKTGQPRPAERTT